jgi:hypothetical protein
VYWHSEEPAASSWWRIGGSSAISVHFYQTTHCHIPRDNSLKSLWYENLNCHYYCCFTEMVTVCCESYWCVCSWRMKNTELYMVKYLSAVLILQVLIDIYSAKDDVCVGPFHTVDYFLLILYYSETWTLHSLSLCFLWFYASSAKTSIRIVLYVCGIYVFPLIPQLYIQIEHKLACCCHLKYCIYCIERQFLS